MPANKIAAIRWADDLISQGGFVVVDTETTDLNGYPIEVAVISSHGEILFDKRIKPPEGEQINPKALATHGILLEVLKDCPEWGAVASDFADAIKGKKVVIYNAEFDASIINRANSKYSIPFRLRNTVCAMMWYAEYHGDRDDYHGNYRWVKLVDAAQALGIDTDGAHSAKGDALMTLKVVQALARLPQGMLISKSPMNIVS